MDARPDSTIEAIEILEQERLRELTGAVGTEIEKENDVVVADALFIGYAKISGGMNSSVLPSLYFAATASAGDVFTCSPLPRTIASHAFLVRSQRRSRSIAKYRPTTVTICAPIFAKAFFAFPQNLCPTGRGGITSVGKGVNKNFFHSCRMRRFGDRQQMM